VLRTCAVFSLIIYNKQSLQQVSDYLSKFFIFHPTIFNYTGRGVGFFHGLWPWKYLRESRAVNQWKLKTSTTLQANRREREREMTLPMFFGQFVAPISWERYSSFVQIWLIAHKKIQDLYIDTLGTISTWQNWELLFVIFSKIVEQRVRWFCELNWRLMRSF
jgi:hypothetical protein